MAEHAHQVLGDVSRQNCQGLRAYVTRDSRKINNAPWKWTRAEGAREDEDHRTGSDANLQDALEPESGLE
jgi:hypothetical protein